MSDTAAGCVIDFGGEHSIPAIEATIAVLKSDLICALATNDNGDLYTRLSSRMSNGKITQLKDKIGGHGSIP